MKLLFYFPKIFFRIVLFLLIYLQPNQQSTAFSFKLNLKQLNSFQDNFNINLRYSDRYEFQTNINQQNINFLRYTQPGKIISTLKESSIFDTQEKENKTAIIIASNQSQYNQQNSQLLPSLSNSLQQLKINLISQGNFSDYDVPILSQVNPSNIYEDVYHFTINLESINSPSKNNLKQFILPDNITRETTPNYLNNYSEINLNSNQDNYFKNNLAQINIGIKLQAYSFQINSSSSFNQNNYSQDNYGITNNFNSLEINQPFTNLFTQQIVNSIATEPDSPESQIQEKIQEDLAKAKEKLERQKEQIQRQVEQKQKQRQKRREQKEKQKRQKREQELRQAKMQQQQRQQ
jgi:hypothetical protein